MLLVKPDTVLRWHRPGFRVFWRGKARAASNTPRLSPEAVALITQLSEENRLWGSRTHKGRTAQAGDPRQQAHDTEVHASCAWATTYRPAVDDVPAEPQ